MGCLKHFKSFNDFLPKSVAESALNSHVAGFFYHSYYKILKFIVKEMVKLGFC